MPIIFSPELMIHQRPRDHQVRKVLGVEKLNLHQGKRPDSQEFGLSIDFFVLNDGIQSSVDQSFPEWFEHFKYSKFDTGSSLGVDDPC